MPLSARFVQESQVLTSGVRNTDVSCMHPLQTVCDSLNICESYTLGSLHALCKLYMTYRPAVHGFLLLLAEAV